MRSVAHRGLPGAQRGWAGMVVVLLGLVIVAFLAKDALKKYGLLSTPPAATKAAAGDRARTAGAMAVDPGDLGSAPASGGAALDRARGVEDMVKAQAAERESRGDGTTR